MGSLLVHITHGPEAPTRAALGVLVASAAVDAGHDVTVFLAGDAAYLVKDEVIGSLNGIGTGALGDTFPSLVEAGVPIFVSGMSAKGRGVSEADLDGKGATFAMPSKLVELTPARMRGLFVERALQPKEVRVAKSSGHCICRCQSKRLDQRVLTS